MRVKQAIALLILIFVFLQSSVHSAIIYSQEGGQLLGAQIPHGLSDLSSQFQYASAFRLTSTDTVRSVTWSGGYENNIFVPTDSFTINFYELDSNNLPGALIASSVVGNLVNRVDSGLDDPDFNRDIYNYAADIDDLPLMESTIYYISIVNDTLSATIWRWATGFNAGLFNAISTSGTSPIWLPAFQILTIDDGGTFALRNTNLVPIPAAVWLFGSALGLLGWISRKNHIK